MARDISFMQYMRAHGNTPGPTQRPLATGIIAGVIAAFPFIATLYFSGAIESLSRSFHVDAWVVFGASMFIAVVAGIIYSLVFKRAANDTRGGWLFGMSFGFLLWMLGPVTIWQTITSSPVAIGRAAMGIFGGQLLYGLVLGLLFPRVHFVLQRTLKEVASEAGTTLAEFDEQGGPHDLTKNQTSVDGTRTSRGEA
jgi:hypothetical protein